MVVMSWMWMMIRVLLLVCVITTVLLRGAQCYNEEITYMQPHQAQNMVFGAWASAEYSKSKLLAAAEVVLKREYEEKEVSVFIKSSSSTNNDVKQHLLEPNTFGDLRDQYYYSTEKNDNNYSSHSDNNSSSNSYYYYSPYYYSLPWILLNKAQVLFHHDDDEHQTKSFAKGSLFSRIMTSADGITTSCKGQFNEAVLAPITDNNTWPLQS